MAGRNTDQTQTPSSQRAHPGSLNDIAYNGSEGHINDRPASMVDWENEEDYHLTAPPKVASPSRPALGSRLLSSLSNAQPAASALSRKGSVLHSRARSLAGFVPKLNASTASTPVKTHAPNRIIAGLFSGESAPIRIGAPVSPTKEREESEFIMEYRPTLTERPISYHQRRNTSQTNITCHSNISTPTINKPSSWFNRKTTNPLPSRPQIQDDLATFNINASLFPEGPADPLNPSAFNDLLLNATTLLQRMQTAYKEKVDYIASVQPEIDAQREEVEEAETRATHLKMQLEDLSQKAQDQERAMQELGQKRAMQELGQKLAEEKIKVLEARDAARTVRLVPRGNEQDESAQRRRRKRGSVGTASDSGFESDLESVFSQNSSGETPLSPPYSLSNVPGPWNARQLNANASNSTLGSVGKRAGRDGAAWTTAEALRSENLELRKQMEEMQRSLQGCIDFVSVFNGR